jgi:NitT/TauT family transport system permease protein
VASDTTASPGSPTDPAGVVASRSGGGRRAAAQRHRRRPEVIDTAIAVGAGLVAWYVLGAFLEHLPMPHEIVASAIDVLGRSESYGEFATTLGRMAIGLAGGFLLGAAIGIAMGARALADGFFRPWVILLLSIPEPVMIISCILIIGIGEASLMIALVLSVTPFVATVTNAGM